MYVLNNQSQGDSGLEPRITDSEYYTLPANLKDHYHDEVDEEEEPFLETELEDSQFDEDDHGEFDDENTTSSTDDDSQFDGFGGGDFGGGGSSDDY